LSIALNDNPSQSYGASTAIYDHTVLPEPYTGERAPPSPQPDTPVHGLPTPEGLEAELTLALVIYGDGLPTCADSHPSKQ